MLCVKKRVDGIKFFNPSGFKWENITVHVVVIDNKSQ